MKDLNPFKTFEKVQGASSILRMGFVLSKYPHFNSAYLVKVRFSLDLAVLGILQDNAAFFKIN